MNFLQKLENSIKKNNTLLCIGLDPIYDKLPHLSLTINDQMYDFNRKIIDTTYHLVCAYKPQIASYSAHGIKGIGSLLRTIKYLKTNHPDIPIILDAKRADIGSTSEQYATEVFKIFEADAVTLNPYFGYDSLEPFLQYTDKGVIILCRTSNKSAADFQDLMIDGKPLYMKVAEKVVEWNKKHNNCLMVVGSTWPNEMKMIRKIAKDMFFLVPGTGTQGGDLEKTLEYGLTKEKSGLIISVSRAIIYASNDKDFAKAARNAAQETRNLINTFRNNKS